MISYKADDIVQAFQKAGVRRGDTLFFTGRLFAVGRLQEAASGEDFCRIYLESILRVIGSEGTLVVPTYTQQVGRFGEKYVH